MFVLADMEWMTNAAGHHSPSQIAAIKVDDKWNEVSSFKSFIRPRDGEFHDWKHVAYTGGTASDFLHARNAHNVLTDFEAWLEEDDILLWWYAESEMLFKKIVSLILKTKEPHKSVSINEYVYEFLSGQPKSRGNSYRIAEARGIETKPNLKHYAINDAHVLLQLMAVIEYPQELLLKPLVKKISSEPKTSVAVDLPYQYEADTNTIHIKGCNKLIVSGAVTIGHKTLNTAIRKGQNVCECCKADMKQTIRERNQDIIDRTQYTYIYSPESKVFHKYSCGIMLSAKAILGTRTYEGILKTKRTPCKVCNPTPSDVYRPIPEQQRLKRLEKKIIYSVPKEEVKAVKRQRVASAERYRKLKDQSLTKTERDDVYTLTQPEFAFFVGRGYQTFHLRSCPRLQELSEIKGYKTYADAVRAGFTPCRKCKPTNKHDVKVSIPITNRVRATEKIEDLEQLCSDAGYEYSVESKYFSIETPAGKWRLDISTSPIKVEHINLIVTPNTKKYHKQPRVFLSFVDAFDYIKRHDTELMRKKSDGTVFVKFFDEDGSK